VQVKYPQPLVRFNLMGGNGPDPYDGLDRFGRLKTALWEFHVPALSVPREHIRYAYDQAGNRTVRDNRLAASGQDELYAYDGLNQLQQLKRGELIGGQIAEPAWQEDFTYDPTGNWHGAASAYVTRTNGTVLDQNRTHNQANEITDITEAVGPSWITPVHDAVGNMTTIPQPKWNDWEEAADQWDSFVPIQRVKMK
jgi:hypothetical protein